MTAKLVYKLVPKAVEMALGVLGGALASALFKRLWKVVGSENDAPSPTNPDRGLAEVLIAGALQGAIIGVVRAGLSRGGALGLRKAPGKWEVD